MRITDHIDLIDGTMANSYYLHSNGHHIIIDAGTAGSGRKIVEFCRQKNISPGIVLITHYHPDHIGGLFALQDAYNPQIYAGAGEIDAIEGRAKIQPARSALAKIVSSLAKPKPVREVKDAQSLKLDFIEVLPTPGHTPASTSYVFKDDSAIFVGDALYERRGSLNINKTFTLDMNAAQASRDRILSSGAVLVLPGHGNPVRLKPATGTQ
ncbi:MAG: MBL fold metallo-hydrolase [Thermoplasmataceae archaeon]